MQRVLVACRAMEASGGPIDTTALARLALCSARQLQRDFTDSVGVTPRAYGRSVRTTLARTALRSALTVTEAILDAGYGSVRAFYEEAGRRLGMTPSEFASGARGELLIWATAPSAVGILIAVASPRGLCAVRIGTNEVALELEIATEFRHANLIRDEVAMTDVMTALRALALNGSDANLPLDIRGTAFQARVWQALREIPSGQTRTYTEVAGEIGSPRAARAVASACANNPIALAIPCHRVIRGDGSLAGYAWGLEVKEQLLDLEARGNEVPVTGKNAR
jgi:AraC family transcriptional regulator of adaptative response/methylated-DNA-[protein]-cysteine methyltransferase